MIIAFAQPVPAQNRASPCPNAMTTAAMNACLDKARAKADAELNRVYNRIRLALGGQDRARLVNAQRSWLVYRDKMCAAGRGLFGLGSGGGPAYLACMERLTRRHTEDLRATFWWKVGK